MQSSDIAGAETFSTALMLVLVHPNKCALEDALAHITILQLCILKNRSVSSYLTGFLIDLTILLLKHFINKTV